MKVRIIGSTGSGKTTLAKLLSNEFNINIIELDDIHWIRNPNGDVRRSLEKK